MRQVRDPIHHFIGISPDEQLLVDSPEFQRLRHIHQLALTGMVYPGASHKRFEHSLGVMHLSKRVFEVITSKSALDEFPKIRELIPELDHQGGALHTDLSTLTSAAILHDVGHMPFSHAAESLLGEGRSHESITAELILGEGISELLRKFKPYVRADEVARAAAGPKYLPEGLRNDPVSSWQGILREILQSNIVGTDRMDYLLRDSYHIGVAYGSFDVHRLISGVRLVAYPEGSEHGIADEETAPQLGVTEGTVQVAEQLQIARYLMFTQVYFHDTRVAYDLSLMEFLVQSLEGGVFPQSLDQYLNITDNEIMASIWQAANDSSHPGYLPARRIKSRDHFRLVYSVSDSEAQQFAQKVLSGSEGVLVPGTQDLLLSKAMYDGLANEFGKNNVRYRYFDSPKRNSIPVLRETGRVEPIEMLSQIFRQTPNPRYEYVFVDQSIRRPAKQWLSESLPKLKLEV